MSLEDSNTTISSLYVPPELLSHIISFCPPSSLAAVTRSSFTFLELASPFLYRTVRLEGAEQLPRLFGSPDVLEDSEESVESEDPAEVSQVDGGKQRREGWTSSRTDLLPPSLSLSSAQNSTSTHLDRITPYLSLSQIKHLTFLALNPDDELTPLSRRRLPSALLLPTLTLSLPPISDFKIIHPTQNTLLYLVSPRIFNLFGRQPSERPSVKTPWQPSPFLDISALPWARLHTVLLLNSSIVSQGHESMILNLADPWDTWRSEISQSLIDATCDALAGARLDGGLRAKVLVVVDTEETKTWFKEMMLDFSGAWEGVSFAALEEILIVKVKEPGGERSGEWDVEDLTLTRMEA